VQSGRRGLRRLLAPQLFDQPVGGDDLVGVQQEERQQCALLLPSEVERSVVVDHLEGAEQPKLHAMPFSRPPGCAHANTASQPHESPREAFC
jgi:hypothetical protein